MSCQAPFRIRGEVARLLGMSEAQVRVIAPDVGGGFGVKSGPYREEVLLAWLAVRLGRPLQWVATRREDQITTNHARGSVCEGELAARRRRRILGLRARVFSPLGASLMNARGRLAVEPRAPAAGRVRDPELRHRGGGRPDQHARRSAAYRGAGRPEACYAIERLMDTAAPRSSWIPPRLRRRNLIPPERFPYQTITGQSYDSGDYHEALSRALAAADYPALRRAQEARRAKGEMVGIGIVSYVEPCALGWESGSVKVERSGRVTAITGSSAHGQGHETTFAQVVADALGVTPEDVTVVHGDTRSGPEGFGTFGSRSTALGGGALVQASTVVRDKGRRIAAKMLEAGVEDVVSVSGGFHVIGAPQNDGSVEGRGRRRLRGRRGAADRRDAGAGGRDLLPGRGRVLELRRGGDAGLGRARHGAAGHRVAGVGGRRGNDHQPAAGRGPAARLRSRRGWGR